MSAKKSIFVWIASFLLGDAFCHCSQLWPVLLYWQAPPQAARRPIDPSGLEKTFKDHAVQRWQGIQSSWAVTQPAWFWQLLNLGSSPMTLVELLGMACTYYKV